MKMIFLLLTLLLSNSHIKAEEKIVANHLSTANGLPDNNIRTLFQDNIGYLYLHTDNASYIYDGYKFRNITDSIFYTRHNEMCSTKKINKNKEKTIYDNLNNKVNISLSGDIKYHDNLTGKILTFHVFEPSILNLTNNIKINVQTSKRDHIWISTNGNGLFVYNKRTGILRHITKDDHDHLISSNAICAMIIDKNDDIWISMEHYGICKLRITEQSQVVNIDSSTEYRANDVRMMQRINNNLILVGNNKGKLYKLDSKLHKIGDIETKGQNILSACLDKNGKLWLGTRLKGILFNGQQINNGRINSIICDKNGDIWACGLDNEVMRITTSSDGKTNLKYYFTNEKKIIPRQILQDHRGNIWIVGDKGVYVFNPNTPDYYTRVSDIKAKNIFEDSHKTIWIGTSTNGILYSDNSKKRACHFNKLSRNDGLPSNNIQFIVEDLHQNILVGTDNGLAWYNTKTKAFNCFYIEDNPIQNFCNENSYALLPDGNIAVGTLDGIVVASVPKKKKIPTHDLALTNLIINGVSIYDMEEHSYKEKFDLHKTIILNHNQNSLTIEFSTFEYENKQNINFSYKLEGYDKEWSTVSDINFASYKNLPSGTYHFNIRYRNLQGEWKTYSDILEITITPPLWATWWAIMCYIILTVIICGIGWRQYSKMNALRQRIALEKQLTEYKLKFFTNISHEFRTPLTLIQGAMDRIKEVNNIPTSIKLPINNMQRSVDRMLRLINQLLEFRKIQNGKLSLALQHTDIITFLYNIFINFHDVADNRNINYMFLPQQKTINGFIDRGMIDKSVYNLLSNAFKYTPQNGEISLNVGLDEIQKNLTIIVCDSGIGIPKDRQQELFKRFETGKINADSIGIGLNLTYELINIHHGNICYKDNPGGGSMFIITIPISKEAYTPEDFIKIKTEIKSEDINEKKGFNVECLEQQAQPLNDKRVLIVEDNLDIQDMLKNKLGKYYVIETANDGIEALEAIQQNCPDLIITDVMMPRMNGYELTLKIRNDNKLRHIPIIMLTALSAESKQEKGLEIGVDAFITKPFSSNILIAQCCNLLYQRDLLKHSYAQAPLQKIEAPKIIREETDKKFINQLDTIITNHISESSLSVDTLAEMFEMGRSSFYRKVKDLTGKTPNTYINEKRMYMGAEMLKDDKLNVSEIAYKLGINSPQYFATAFKKMFGVSPTDYQKGKKK